jgi:hypothetical protein
MRPLCAALRRFGARLSETAPPGMTGRWQVFGRSLLPLLPIPDEARDER